MRQLRQALYSVPTPGIGPGHLKPTIHKRQTWQAISYLGPADGRLADTELVRHRSATDPGERSQMSQLSGELLPRRRGLRNGHQTPYRGDSQRCCHMQLRSAAGRTVAIVPLRGKSGYDDVGQGVAVTTDEQRPSLTATLRDHIR